MRCLPKKWRLTSVALEKCIAHKLILGSFPSAIAGNGEVELGGKANDMTIDIAGSGDVNAKALTTNTLKVSISGSGTVKADVTTDLDASISGSGDVLYSGSPHVNSSVSGSGTVKKIEVQ
jgi:hypothetical protein